MTTEIYNPLNHSVVQAYLKADGYQSYECPEFVEAFLFHIKGELERVYWNVRQEQLADREDWQFLDFAPLEYRRYFWGDCDCGFEERWSAKEEEWHKHNQHSSVCYQAELKGAIEAWQDEYGERRAYENAKCDRFTVTDMKFDPKAMFGMGEGDVHHFETYEDASAYLLEHGGTFQSSSSPEAEAKHEKWRKLHDLKGKFEQRLAAKLTKKFGLPIQGWGVHCTCDYKEKWNTFASTDGHGPSCSPQLPNLRFGEVCVSWYKYMGRGMSVNQDWSERQWREWFDSVIKHIQSKDIR